MERIVDLLKGLYSIGNVIYYSVSGGVAALADLTCPDTPEWAKDALGVSYTVADLLIAKAVSGTKKAEDFSKILAILNQ